MSFSERKDYIAKNINAEQLKLVCLSNQSDCSTRQRALSIESPGHNCSFQWNLTKISRIWRIRNLEIYVSYHLVITNSGQMQNESIESWHRRQSFQRYLFYVTWDLIFFGKNQFKNIDVFLLVYYMLSFVHK